MVGQSGQYSTRGTQDSVMYATPRCKYGACIRLNAPTDWMPSLPANRTPGIGSRSRREGLDPPARQSPGQRGNRHHLHARFEAVRAITQVPDGLRQVRFEAAATGCFTLTTGGLSRFRSSADSARATKSRTTPDRA